MENKKVFVDSSVLIAACLSSSGASYFCLISAPLKGYKFLINEFIFEEISDVLKRKFLGLTNKFFGLLSIGNFSILKNPGEKELKSVKGLVEEKDAPILTSAIVEKADYLLTLDKGFFKKEIIDFAKNYKLVIPSLLSLFRNLLKFKIVLKKI